MARENRTYLKQKIDPSFKSSESLKYVLANMKAENKNKKITFWFINRNLSLLKIKKKIVQKKTKNSVTAIPAIKDKGIIKSSIVRL